MTEQTTPTQEQLDAQRAIQEQAVNLFNAVHSNPLQAVIAWMLAAQQISAKREFLPKSFKFQLGMIMEEVSELASRFDDTVFSPALKAELHANAERLKSKDTTDEGVYKALKNNPENAKKILDDLLDTIWVTVGAAAAGGFAVQEGWDEVARANFEKFSLCDSPNHTPHGCPECGGLAMKAVRDANGKVVKPAGWREPDHSNFLPAGLVDPLNIT